MGAFTTLSHYSAGEEVKVVRGVNIVLTDVDGRSPPPVRKLLAAMKLKLGVVRSRCYTGDARINFSM